MIATMKIYKYLNIKDIRKKCIKMLNGCIKVLRLGSCFNLDYSFSVQWLLTFYNEKNKINMFLQIVIKLRLYIEKHLLLLIMANSKAVILNIRIIHVPKRLYFL